jgi:uncharacterized protein (TIRG00374 family)
MNEPTLQSNPAATGKGDRWRVAIGMIVSAGCIGVLLWQIDWQYIVRALGSMEVKWLPLASLLLLGCYASFAVRWWILLGCDPAQPPRRLFAILMMGLAVNVTLPLRPGDALRAYLLGQVYGGGVSRAVASILMERILDVFTILVFGILVSFQAQLPDSMVGAFIAISLLNCAVVLAVLALAFFAAPTSNALARLAAKSRHRWIGFVRHQLIEFARALTLDGLRERLALAAVVGAVGWILYCAAMIACATAFEISSPIIGGVLLTVLTNLGGVIPSSPGSIGIYHALAVLALVIAGASQELALAVAIVSHALVVVVQLVLGLLAFHSVSEAVRLSIGRKAWRTRVQDIQS